MSNTNRPTTALAVDASLRADADFRGINEAGKVHYLLGMCEARLAQANTDLERLERRLAEATERLDAMEADAVVALERML